LPGVSYLISDRDYSHIEYYVITSDHKVKQYSVDINDGKTYDFFAGELPPEDRYTVAEYEIDELDWTSIVNVLTRVDFMTLLDEFPALTKDCESTYYIQVETGDAVHKSGGYGAGFKKDPESRRFSEAQQQIQRALNRNG